MSDSNFQNLRKSVLFWSVMQNESRAWFVPCITQKLCLHFHFILSSVMAITENKNQLKKISGEGLKMSSRTVSVTRHMSGQCSISLVWTVDHWKKGISFVIWVLVFGLVREEFGQVIFNSYLPDRASGFWNIGTLVFQINVPTQINIPTYTICR